MNLLWKVMFVRLVWVVIPLVLFSVIVSNPTEVLAAGPNLFVSAENALNDNYFGGPMVIEVQIVDSAVSNINSALAEPDVTVNGKILRMVQANDGNWYAYFADIDMAQRADSTTSSSGIGLDFGMFCANNDGKVVLGFDVSDTAGFAVDGIVTGATHGLAAIVSDQCSTNSNGVTINNVVKQPPNFNSVINQGQIGLDANAWPFIQLYDFSPTGNVVIQYNKGGGAQSTTLTFDTMDHLVDTTLDRSVYTTGSEVHFSITDFQLNIDPTDEDSWTFETGDDDTLQTLYQVFDKNGQAKGDGFSANLFDIRSDLNNLMFEDNGVLIITIDAQSSGTNVLTLQDNADQNYVDDTDSVAKYTQDARKVSTKGGTLAAGTQPVTIVEQGVNSGIFVTYDEADKSNFVVTDNALRGTFAIVDYNETPMSILVGFDFASIDIQPIDDEWNSGEEIPVVIVDNDANKNSRIDEDMDLNNPRVDLIPSLTSGNPFTLESLASVKVITKVTTNVTIDEVQQFSQRAILVSPKVASNDGNIIFQLTLGDTYGDLFGTINNPNEVFEGFNFFNYDVRSVKSGLSEGNIDNVSVHLYDSSGPRTSTIVTTSGLQGFVNLDDAIGDNVFSFNQNQQVVLLFDFSTTGTTSIDADTKLPMVADFFSYGFLNDGILPEERIANQIIRIEAEESGDNTGIFEGSLEYVMINQLNVNDINTYSSLTTIADDPSFIVINSLTDENSPRVNYLDLGADGVSTQISDQQSAPTHSGSVSFDSSSYEKGNTVTVTLNDLDLNVDSDLLEIYTVVSDVSDDTFDQVGAGDLQTLSFGNLGALLEITIDDSRWTTPQIGNTCGDSLRSLTSITGLGSSGFMLVETDTSSGIFEGNFEIPSYYCDTTTTNPPFSFIASPISTAGKDFKVNYFDFRDGSGEITTTTGSGTVESEFEGQIDFDSLKGASYPKDGATIIFPENLDALFPTVQNLNKQLEKLNFPTNRYHLEKIAYEEENDIVIEETLTVNIENYEEFLKVFEITREEHVMPFSIDGIQVDSFIDQKIREHKDSCAQNSQKEYCGLSQEEIKQLIVTKTGTHTISESTTIKKISTLNGDSSFENENQAEKLIPVTYSKNDENIQQILYDLSVSLDKIDKTEMLPSVLAQSDDNNLHNTFLNGFTIGYGFEKTWFYEFEVLDITSITVDAHIENGLGMGLRIPIEVELGIKTTGNQFQIDYTINTKDLSEREYEEMLGPFQSFGGNEFKIYLGPKVHLEIKIFEESVYSYSKGVIETPEENDFRPPLDNAQTREKITEYVVPCNITSTCLDLDVVNIGLSLGVISKISGEKVTLNADPSNSNQGVHEIQFRYNNEPTNISYKILDENKPYGVKIKDLKYHSDLHFIPQAKVGVEIPIWFTSIEFSTGWIQFPEILFEDIIFERHEGTDKEFSILSDLDNPPPPQQKLSTSCGVGTELVNGICQVVIDKEPETKGGGGCLIATAAYGTELAPQVQLLREIRDNTVMSTSSGSAFMTGFNQFYYSFSPYIADLERENPMFQEVVRAFITPMVSTLSIMTFAEDGNELQVLGLGISVIALNLGLYIAAPAATAWQIKKRI